MDPTKLLILGTFVLMGSVIVQAQKQTDATPRNEVSNPEKFQFITINGQQAEEMLKPCRRTLKECAYERLVQLGYDGFGGPDSNNPKEETFTFRNGRKTIGIFLLTMTGFEDDLVAGERVRIAFERRGNRWQYVQAGRQFKCARGVNTGNWTKELCP